MARYTGPVCRLCRREDMKLFLKGDRCYTDKCGFERRAYAPGQHGQARRRKLSNYGEQLREKQKVKRIYGIAERQFRGYYYKALRLKGVTGENLLVLLERRMDNIVYRFGFASDHAEARQLVRHGHFLVNGKKVDIPSYRVGPHDIVEVRPKSVELTPFVVARAQAGSRTVPAWLEVIPSKMKILVHSLPARQVIDTPVQEQLIVELYSR